LLKSSELKGAIALRCAGVSKRFHYYEHRTSSLREWFIRSILRKPIHVRRSYFTLSNLNLEVRRGESLAIVGPNGSGKSTLLRLIAGIYEPTTGIIDASGRIATVIELGAGFSGELSGAENIELYGATFGLSRKEIEAHMESVVSFSGIGEFVDTPVKYYSSGMHARLAFSVITCVQPDILLLDEVLAVGDKIFRQKCIDWLDQFHSMGGTLVVVTHDLDLAAKLCGRAIWLETGAIKLDGVVDDVIPAYRNLTR
jgi:ABC-type polysaccharide/polyol phosphate transport system ATPase subunit